MADWRLYKKRFRHQIKSNKQIHSALLLELCLRYNVCLYVLIKARNLRDSINQLS